MLVFRAEDVSLLDINALIDKGKRFTLVTNGEEADKVLDVEEYLKDETKVNVSGKYLC